LSFKAVAWCKDQDCNIPLTKLVLVWLCEYADENNSCYPSQKHLAKLCGVTDRSVRRSLKWLEDNNLIKIKHVSGTSNRYFVSMDISDHTPLDAPVQPDRTPKSDNKKEYKKDISKEFDEWWILYPRKVSKYTAYASYTKALKDLDHEIHMQVLLRVVRDWVNTDKKFIPHPTTWLNQKRYFDYVKKDGRTYKLKNIKNNNLNNLAG